MGFLVGWLLQLVGASGLIGSRDPLERVSTSSGFDHIINNGHADTHTHALHADTSTFPASLIPPASHRHTYTTTQRAQMLAGAAAASAAAAAIGKRPALSLLRLGRGVGIREQLWLEEALLRHDARNW